MASIAGRFFNKLVGRLYCMIPRLRRKSQT